MSSKDEEAERERYNAVEAFFFDLNIGATKSEREALVVLLRDRERAAERRGWERGLEEAARECDGERMACERHAKALPKAPVHQVGIQIADVCARRIRALRERGPR